MPKDDSPRPTAEVVRAARLALGLSQAEAAAMVHLGALSRWSEIERGITQMDPARWELFAIKTGTHPGFKAVKPAKG